MTFNGKIGADCNPCSVGLVNHLKQKQQIKRRKMGSRKTSCFGVYQHRGLVSTSTGDVDISTSLVTEDEEPTSPIPKRKRPSEDHDGDNFHIGEELDDIAAGELEDESHEVKKEEYDYSDVFYSSMLLKPSNSLGKTSDFSNEVSKNVFSQDSKLSIKDLNMQSLPSTKLLPPIALETLLSYDTSKLIDLKEQAKHILKNLQTDALIGTLDLQEHYSSEEEESQVDFGDSDEEEGGESEEEEDDEAQEEDLPEVHASAKYLVDRSAKEQANREHLSDNIPNDVYIHLLMMQLQEKHGLSMSAVDDIYNWAHKSFQIHPHIFKGKKPARDKMLCEYKRLMGMEDAFDFKETIVQWLPDLRPTSQYVRPFLDCVYELLTNKTLLGPHSCNISLPHETDPFKCEPGETPKYVSELHHGNWWGRTMRKKRRGRGPDSCRILCPLLLETDATHTDVNGRLQACPVNIKLGIFNNATRKKNEAATTWFYLPDDEVEASHHQQKTLSLHKIQNLHSALRNGFSELKFLMDNDIGLEWELYYGGELHKVELVFSIAFTISDTAMHNKLCAKYNVNNSNIQSVCRHCNITTDDLIDTEAFRDAKLWEPKDFDLGQNDPEDLQYWQSVSHHPVQNAMDELCHGSNRHGGHLATPGEFLHMHQKGALKRSVESFEYQFRKGTKIVLDEKSLAKKQKGVTKGIDNINYIGHQVGVLLARQSDRNKPRTKFKNALLTTTKKSAHEHAGVVLCLLVALLTDRGRQICLEERTMDEDFLDNFVYIFEMVLIVEQWLSQDSLPGEEVLDSERLYKALSVYIDNVGKICQREGMGAKVPKNHLMLHLPQYIAKWGIPSGWDGSNMERGHIKGVKQPAKLTQRRQDSFIPQLATKYGESRLIQRMLEFTNLARSLWYPTKLGKAAAKPKQDHCGGSLFKVGLDVRNGIPGLKWAKHPGRQCHVQCVLDLVYDNIVANLPTDESERVVKGFTEYKKQNDDGTYQMFRAHPSYRSRSRQQRDVWYDWALFDLEKQGLGKYLLPGQILMFVHVPFLQEEVEVHGVKLQPNRAHAVVRLFKEAPTPDFRAAKVNTDTGGETDYSMLVEFGQVRDDLLILPCHCIMEPTIVIPNIPMLAPKDDEKKGRRRKREREEMNRLIEPKGEGFFVVSPRSEWSQCFSRLIQSFNPTPR